MTSIQPLQELPIEHDCIYRNDLVADGGRERVGSGKVYVNEDKNSMHAYLGANATRALGVDQDVELDVYRVENGLLVVPSAEDGLGRTVRCRYCDHVDRPSEMWDHHVNQHPGERYDPIWYSGRSGGSQ